MLRILILSLLFVACTTVPRTERDLPDLTIEEIDQKIHDAMTCEEKIMYDENTYLREKNLIPDKVLKDWEGVEKNQGELRNALKCRSLPPSVDLRKYDQRVVRQWNGTCTAHAQMAAAENLLCKSNKWCKKLSERHQWSNQIKNCRQPYSSHCAVLTHKSYKVAEDKYWPHNNSSPRVPDINKLAKVKLLEAPYIGNDVKKMQCYLSQGYPVVLAMKTPQSMLRCDDVINPNSNPSSGGHAISIVGYKVSQKYGVLALIKNSWGSSCGMGGYQYVPTSIFFRPSYYAAMWPITKVSIEGANPVQPVPRVKKCVEHEKYWCGGSKWYKLFLPWKKCKKCVKWTYQQNLRSVSRADTHRGPK